MGKRWTLLTVRTRAEEVISNECRQILHNTKAGAAYALHAAGGQDDLSADRAAGNAFRHGSGKHRHFTSGRMELVPNAAPVCPEGTASGSKVDKSSAPRSHGGRARLALLGMDSGNARSGRLRTQVGVEQIGTAFHPKSGSFLTLRTRARGASNSDSHGQTRVETGGLVLTFVLKAVSELSPNRVTASE
jgi:hypothetical protein